MWRLARRGLVTGFRALWARALVLILLGMTAGVASAQTGTPTAPDTPSQVPGQVPTPTTTPPGVTWGNIRHDTPEEREAFLQQRAISLGLRVPTEVPPLPQQQITPPALRQP